MTEDNKQPKEETKVEETKVEEKKRSKERKSMEPRIEDEFNKTELPWVVRI